MKSHKGHEALFCEGSLQIWYHRWCVGECQEDYQLLASSSNPFLCPACAAKGQCGIIQQLQCNTESLNVEVLELRNMVTTLQSAGPGVTQRVGPGDSQVGSEAHHSKKASPTSTASQVPWNVFVGRKDGKNKNGKGKVCLNVITPINSGHASPSPLHTN